MSEANKPIGNFGEQCFDFSGKYPLPVSVVRSVAGEGGSELFECIDENGNVLQRIRSNLYFLPSQKADLLERVRSVIETLDYIRVIFEGV